VISSITFETASLADVIKKADKIAPSKGAAFDKAAGIVIEFDPNQSIPLALVRSTNLDIFSMEWVNVAEWSGEPAVWRLPSFLLAQVIGSLPIGSGKTVTLTSEESGHSFHVNLKSGRTKAKFFPLDASYYPQWGAFNPDNMFPVNDLGGRIDQVEWAAGKNDPRLAGVYLDGKHAVATDTYRLACVPLNIPDLTAPIVVPAGLLGQTLRQTGEIQIGMAGDNMLHIMPDDHTQMKTVVYDVQYPNVQSVINREFSSQLKVERDRLIDVMNRTNTFAVGDRTAAFRVFVGKEEVAIFMQNEEIGQIGDVVEIPGQAEHERFEIRFTPKNLMEALSKSPNNEITIHYDQGNPKSIFKIDGGSGYQAWVMPRLGGNKGGEE
jgi:DNA polymerase III sliding clamp (beta) subunit (PCNA family)